MTTTRRPLPEQPQMSPASRLLARHGISARDIASRLGCHQSYISHQLTGRRRFHQELLAVVTELAGAEVAAELEEVLVAQGSEPVKQAAATRALHDAGVTLTDIAYRAGVSASQVSRVINGHGVSARVHAAVTSALNVVAGADVFADTPGELGEGAR